jgi:hypothetical protein
MDYFVCLDIDFETIMRGSLKNNSIFGGQDGTCNVDYSGFEFEPNKRKR